MGDHLLSMIVSNAKKGGGEGRNRTYPPAQSVGATVLKTATTTRHASLSQQMEISRAESALGSKLNSYAVKFRSRLLCAEDNRRTVKAY